MCKAFDFHREIFSRHVTAKNRGAKTDDYQLGKVHRLIALVKKFIEQDTNLKRSE